MCIELNKRGEIEREKPTSTLKVREIVVSNKSEQSIVEFFLLSNFENGRNTTDYDSFE